jgi:hypothetical protein
METLEPPRAKRARVDEFAAVVLTQLRKRRADESVAPVESAKRARVEPAPHVHARACACGARLYTLDEIAHALSDDAMRAIVDRFVERARPWQSEWADSYIA